jgi:hypothetical protein
MRSSVPLLLAASLLQGCAASREYDVVSLAPATATRIRCEDGVYVRMTGSRLRRILAGAQMSRTSDAPDHCLRGAGQIVMTSPDAEEFSDDGISYRREADRVGYLPGTYDVEPDRFCARIRGGSPTCRALYRNASGRFLVRSLTPSEGKAVPVHFRPKAGSRPID